MYSIKINGKLLYAEEGTLLSDVLMKNGEPVVHLCGGRGTCRKCVVLVNGKEELSCRYRINSDISVVLPEDERIFSESGVKADGHITDNICFALDIGTTTLALALVSVDEKQIIRVVTASNPQRAFGADVISRIQYCKERGCFDLQSSLIEKLNSMISEFNIDTVDKLYVAGNTTMLHLLLGVDCSSIGVAPYTPAFLEGQTVSAEELKLEGVRQVITLPNISSFIGADIVAGLNSVEMPPKGKHSILVDLGTNAEIVLFSEEDSICTAAAAGPCFEGANISRGMSATSGAICAFSIDQMGEKHIKTIENAPAKGLCGTGLIDTVAELLRVNAIDETGYLEDSPYYIAEDVTLDQNDIRQFQLAKSAVYAAMLTLMNIKKIDFDQIDRLYLSGGFSAHIDLENAKRTGLLPCELVERCVPLNNSSLQGTVKFALESNDLSKHVNNARYVDLSSDLYFCNAFVEYMMFNSQ